MPGGDASAYMAYDGKVGCNMLAVWCCNLSALEKSSMLQILTLNCFAEVLAAAAAAAAAAAGGFPGPSSWPLAAASVLTDAPGMDLIPM